MKRLDILKDQPKKDDCPHCAFYRGLGESRCPWCKRIIKIHNP